MDYETLKEQIQNDVQAGHDWVGMHFWIVILCLLGAGGGLGAILLSLA